MPDSVTQEGTADTACRVGRQLARDKWGNTHPVLPLTRAEWDALLEYSFSLPTGTTPGKRWKRDLGKEQWAVGEYNPDGYNADGTIEINWYLPSIDGGEAGKIEGPAQ